MPAKTGRPKLYHTDEERLAAIRENKRRHRNKNRYVLNAKDAERGRRKRAARAIAEGRPVGKTGNWQRFTKEDHKRKRREYVEKNRDLIRMHVRIRSARRKSADGSFSIQDVSRLFDLQKGKCVFCLKPLNKTRFHIDHYEPLCRGGSNDKGNLRLMHKRCNLLKGARDPAEHALKHGLLCW